jgi:hypothetical protein
VCDCSDQAAHYHNLGFTSDPAHWLETEKERKESYIFNGYICRLDGAIFGVLAIGSTACGFKPSRGDEFLRAIQIRSTPSFGEEVKPSALCRNILRHVKIASKYGQIYFEGQIYNFLRQVPPNFLIDGCTGVISRELGR